MFLQCGRRHQAESENSVTDFLFNLYDLEKFKLKAIEKLEPEWPRKNLELKLKDWISNGEYFAKSFMEYLKEEGANVDSINKMAQSKDIFLSAAHKRWPDFFTEVDQLFHKQTRA